PRHRLVPLGLRPGRRVRGRRPLGDPHRGPPRHRGGRPLASPAPRRAVSPHASVWWMSHRIPAHDVRAGALALVRSVQYLAPGVVLAVVDPGVGTDRRGAALPRAGGGGGG